MSVVIAIYSQKTTFCPILRAWEWNFWQMGVIHLRVPVQVLCNCGWLWVRRCHFVRSCVLGDGILDDSSLKDVRGDRNLSRKDDFLSNLAFLGWNFWQMGVTHLRVPVQVLCNCGWLWVSDATLLDHASLGMEFWTIGR